jgi:hypothetical protein
MDGVGKPRNISEYAVGSPPCHDEKHRTHEAAEFFNGLLALPTGRDVEQRWSIWQPRVGAALDCVVGVRPTGGTHCGTDRADTDGAMAPHDGAWL